MAGGDPQAVVDVDVAAGLETHRLQAEVGGERPAPNRDEQMPSGHEPAVLEVDGDLFRHRG